MRIGPSSIRKRSIYIGDRKTSLSMEDEFWDSFRTIAALRRQRLSDLAEEVDTQRTHANLSSAIRLFVLAHYQAAQAAQQQAVVQ